MSFQVEFTGNILEGHTREQVIDRFAALVVNVSPEQVDRLFSNTQNTVIKRDLTQQQATQLILELTEIGMECMLSHANTAHSATAETEGATADTDDEEEEAEESQQPQDHLDPARINARTIAAYHMEVAEKCGYSLEDVERPDQEKIRNHLTDSNEEIDQTLARRHALDEILIDDEEILFLPRNAGIAAPFLWIKNSFLMFAKKPVSWIAITAIFLTITLILSLIPIIQFFAFIFFQPLLAGISALADTQKKKGELPILRLFSGFTHNLTSLLGAALLVFICSAGLTLNALATIDWRVLVGFFVEIQSYWNSPDALSQIAYFAVNNATVILKPVLLLIIPSYILSIVIMLTPSLVMLQHQSAIDAIKQSVVAAFKNAHVFLLFSLLSSVLLALGSLLFGIGILLTLPIVLVAYYLAYRDIFLHDGDPE